MLASTINLTTLKKHTPDTHTSMQAQTSIFKRNPEPSTTTPEGASWCRPDVSKLNSVSTRPNHHQHMRSTPTTKDGEQY